MPLEDKHRMSKRIVSLNLPAIAWDFLEQDADVLKRSLSAECSDLILTALQANGFDLPPREKKP